MRTAWTRGSRIAAVLLVCAACGGGGGGGGERGGGAPAEVDGPDPATDFFLTGAAFGRPILAVDGSLVDVVNPASLHETDPLTGAVLPDYPRPLHEGAALDALASIDLAQVLDPLTPQLPRVPRNAALVLTFSRAIDAESVRTVTSADGDRDVLGPSSTVQVRRRTGGLVPARAFVDGRRLVVTGITSTTPGFEASPLVFDAMGFPVQDPAGHLQLVFGSGVGVGTLASADGRLVVPRADRLGSLARPFPFNPGNSAFDAVVLQGGDDTVGFNGFLPDLTPPRIVRRVTRDGTVTALSTSGGALEVRDDDLVPAPVTAANGGAGEWARALIEFAGADGPVRRLVERHENVGTTAVFRLEPDATLPPDVGPGTPYRLVRTEAFEPIPGPIPVDPAERARVTVDPVDVPRDPDDPQDLRNHDLRWFVRMFDEDGVELTQHWDPDVGLFGAVPPRVALRLTFSEAMDPSSARPYETLFVTGAEGAPTDPGFDDMRVGVTRALDDGRTLEFRPFLDDPFDPADSRFIGFGGTPQTLRLVVRTVPERAVRDALLAAATPATAAGLHDLDDRGITGVIDRGGRAPGLPAALLDQGDPEHFLLAPGNPIAGPFPPAVDATMLFTTLPSEDPDVRAVVHRFLGRARTGNFAPPAGVPSDSVTTGIEYHDHPPVDADGDGVPERRHLYGPRTLDVSLNLPGRLSGSSAAVIQHVVDDLNPPKPSPFASPNGEDFLISLGFGVSTPINSGYGARFQHVYRAGDASPDQYAFEGVSLDLVGLAWSPFADQINNTVLEDFELLVGLSGVNRGRGPSTAQTNGIPVQDGETGLEQQFDCNRLEHLGDCCNVLTPNLTTKLAANPQPSTTTLVRKGTTYPILATNLFRPANAGPTYHQYLDYPTFDAGIDPVFGRDDVFAFPYDSRFPMLIEYAIGPNTAPPAGNLYRFSPGVLTSVLPRFRIWSQGQPPSAWGVPGFTVANPAFNCGQDPMRAGEGGPLLKPGCFTQPVAPEGPHNGMPVQEPSAYILPPRVPINCAVNQSQSLQPEPDLTNGLAALTSTQPPICCIMEMPTPNTDPRTNWYFANGMLMHPLPNTTAYPGPGGLPPTFWYGYGVPPTAGSCLIPPNLAGSNQTNPVVLSHEPGMTPYPGEYGDNARYAMLWKYRKRVSRIESPTLRTVGDTVRYLPPVLDPPLSAVDPSAALLFELRAGTRVDLGASAGSESGWVRMDEPDLPQQLSGGAGSHVWVKFRLSLGAAPGVDQPPALDTVVIPYERLH